MRVFLFLLAATALPAADLRLGIVGTDTSHSVAFTALLNDPANKNHLAGARVVAAYKGGSSDIKESSGRVDKYADELKSKYGVELTPDIPTLLTKVDAILLESVDGRKHLEQFRQIVKAGKPVFIDKPLASTLFDAREIARLAQENNVKWFSASVLRFSDVLPTLKVDGLNGVYAWGPGPLEEHHQLSLSWYGVHTVETLYTMLGRGCEEVTFTGSEDADVVTGKWRDGRIGTIRVIRPYSAFGVTAFSAKAIKTNDKDLYTGYQNLVKEIIQFFQTGKPPIDEQETLEMFAFMDAAQRSKDSGGTPTKLR
ncbi:MAG: Gfo/Idh/MocA family oxidoreductase [Acidobacteria bacterium]|nr:Gfo/Idh/MocA family oxidoreductase [Acidobacteriota bacterium]